MSNIREHTIYLKPEFYFVEFDFSDVISTSASGCTNGHTSCVGFCPAGVDSSFTD